MIEQLLDKNTVSIFNQDNYRFVVFLIFVSYNFYIGISINPYAAISKPLEIAYQASFSQVLSTMIGFIIGKILFASVAGLILEKIGLKLGIFVGLLMMTCGCFLRTWIEISFNFLIIGQFIIGMGGSVIISSQLKFLYEWFHPKGRGFYCTIISLSMTIGGGVGLVFMFFFLKNDEKDVKLIKEGLENHDNFNLVLMMTFLVLHTVLFLSKPRKGFGFIRKSADALLSTEEPCEESEKSETSELSAFNQAEILLQQPIFIRFFIIYTGFVILNLELNSTFTIVFSHFGLTDGQKVLILLSVLGAGISGSFYYFKYFMPHSDNKKIFSKFISISVLFLVLNLFLLSIKAPIVIIWLSYTSFGFCFFMGIPVAMEFIIREVKNVPLNFVNSFIFFFSQICGVLALLTSKLIFYLCGTEVKTAIYLNFTLFLLTYTPILIFLRKI